METNNLKNESKSLEQTFTICSLLNKVNGETKQYAGFTYTKINSIYGYLGIDGNKVIFIYSDQRGVVVDVLDNYEIINEKLNLDTDQPVLLGSLPSRKSIRKIIELTANVTSKKNATGNNKEGDVWGQDCFLGNIDKLINEAEKIIRNDL